MSQNRYNVSPPPELLGKILARIERDRYLFILRTRLIFFSLGILMSLVLFFPALKNMLKNFSGSGFITFFSLLFSDFYLVILNWQSFLLTLLESLPIISILICLGIIFIIFVFLLRLFKDIKIVFKLI